MSNKYLIGYNQVEINDGFIIDVLTNIYIPLDLYYNDKGQDADQINMNKTQRDTGSGMVR